MIVIYLLFSLYSAYLYRKKQYTRFLFFFAGIISYGYGFLPSPAPFKVSDIVLICIIICLFQHPDCLKDSSKVGKIIKYLLLYFTIITIGSILLGIDSVKYCLMTFRFELYFLAYFIFRKIPFSDVHKTFRKIRIVSIVTGIFYYLQFIGINGILVGVDEEASIDMYSRLTNCPFFTTFFFFYTLLQPARKTYIKILELLFWGGIIVAIQSRGLMIAVVIATFSYLLLKSNIKMAIKHILPLIIVFLIAMPVISYRFVGEGSTNTVSSDISTSLNLLKNTDVDMYDNGVIYSDGTFTFRILLVVERMEYLLKSPVTTCFGVGTVHGNSPNINKYHFRIGAIDEIKNKVKQIDTTDVAFITHIMRYGLLYFFLFCWLITELFKRFRSQTDILNSVCLVSLLCMIAQCLGSDTFSGLDRMFTLFLVAASSYPINQKRIVYGK